MLPGMTNYYSIESYGANPILVSIPHDGHDWDNPGYSWTEESPYHPTDLKERDERISDRNAIMIGRTLADRLEGMLLRSHMSRLWCDIERYPDDREEMNRVGMGVIYTRDADLRPLYPEGLEPDDRERERRMRLLYAPYHGMIDLLVARMLHDNPNRRTLLLDVHTYPTTPLAYELHPDEHRPQVDIGVDPQHPIDMRHAETLKQLLRNHGIDADINRTFKGAIRPDHVDSPHLTCIMIETRRDLNGPQLERTLQLVGDWATILITPDA